MSIFVDPSDRVVVTVNYEEKDGKLEVLEKPSPTSKTVTVKFRLPDFELSQRLLAMHTRITPTGEQSVNFVQLQNSLIYELGEEWDVVDDKSGDPVPLTPQNISKLKVDFARALVGGLSDKIGSVI